MKLIPGEAGSWLLIDETAPPDANLIANLKSPIEILAVKRLCEELLGNGDVPREFEFASGEGTYRVTPFNDRGDRLSLKIVGGDGSLWRVETEFRWPS